MFLTCNLIPFRYFPTLFFHLFTRDFLLFFSLFMRKKVVEPLLQVVSVENYIFFPFFSQNNDFLLGNGMVASTMCRSSSPFTVSLSVPKKKIYIYMINIVMLLCRFRTTCLLLACTNHTDYRVGFWFRYLFSLSGILCAHPKFSNFVVMVLLQRFLMSCSSIIHCIYFF